MSSRDGAGPHPPRLRPADNGFEYATEAEDLSESLPQPIYVDGNAGLSDLVEPRREDPRSELADLGHLGKVQHQSALWTLLQVADDLRG